MLTAVSVNQSLDSLVVCNRLSIEFYFILPSHPPAIDHCTHILESRFGITLQTHSLYIYLTTHRLMAHFASPHPTQSLIPLSQCHVNPQRVNGDAQSLCHPNQSLDRRRPNEPRPPSPPPRDSNQRTTIKRFDKYRSLTCPCYLLLQPSICEIKNLRILPVDELPIRSVLVHHH